VSKNRLSLSAGCRAIAEVRPRITKLVSAHVLGLLALSVISATTGSAQVGSSGFETGPDTAELSFSANDADGLLWYATNERSTPNSGVRRIRTTLAAPAAEGSFYALLQADPGAYAGAPLGIKGPFGVTGAGRIYATFNVTPDADYTLTFQHAQGELHSVCRGGTNNGNTCVSNLDCPGTLAECREDPNLSIVEVVDMDGARFCSGGSRAGALCGKDSDCPSSSCGGVPADIDPADSTLEQHAFVTPQGTAWRTESFHFRAGPFTTTIAVAFAVAGESGATAAFDDLRIRNRSAHFTCYKSRFDKTAGPGFAESPLPQMLCTPTEKNFEGLANEVDHLTGYKAKVPFEPAISEQVVNQFGTIFVDALKPDLLMVPSLKLLGSAPTPGYTSDSTDEFQCYRVKLSAGNTFTPIAGVNIEDQFGDHLVNVLKPRRLCMPAGTVAHPESNPDDMLMCYQIRPTVKTKSPSATNDIYVSNRFGTQPLSIAVPRELCVPSTRTEPCDDDIYCTLDKWVTFIPETEPDEPTADPETICVHEMRYGPAFGTWKIDPDSGQNISPCCEDDSDCDDGNPCTFDRCYSTAHQCVFEDRDPATCGTTPVPPFDPGQILPCGADEQIGGTRALPCNGTGPMGELCDLSCIPGSTDGDACPPDERYQLPDHVNLTGYADIHVHAFAEETFGGGWTYGKVRPGLLNEQVCDGGHAGDHGTIHTILPILNKVAQCELNKGKFFQVAGILGVSVLADALGSRIMSEMFSKTEGSAGDSGRHFDRYRSPSGWTRWDSIVHQRVRRDDLYKAWQNGFRLMVVELTGQTALCELIGPSPGNNCKEMGDEHADVERQIVDANEFVAAEEAAAQSQNKKSWVQIVTTPAEAMLAISQKKLALVLSFETTDLFGGMVSTPPTLPEIQAAVESYRIKGVSMMHIVHMTDSPFSGAAQADKTAQLLQFMDNPQGPSFECQDEDCAGKTVYGFNVCQDPTDDFCKNEIGLTPAGEMLVDTLMEKKMLIDISHTSERAMRRLWEKARDNRYYPMHFSHTRFREIVSPEDATEYTVPAWMVQRVRRLGGIIGIRPSPSEVRSYSTSATVAAPRVANDCAGSSRSFAQIYDYGLRGLKVPMSIGTDLNGPAMHSRPRFINNSLPGKPRSNRNGACSAGFRAEGICQSQAQSDQARLGTRFDTVGVADISSLPDLMEDMKRLGLGADVDPLRYRSAEEFVRMWLRARDEEPTGPRVGPADLANDVDVSGINDYVPIGTREEIYGKKCFQRYCPESVELGGECKFDEECKSGLKCGGIGLCGTVKGKCVCDDDEDCGSDKFCKKGWPINAVDNECLAKRETGARCRKDVWCVSGDCHLFKCT